MPLLIKRLKPKNFRIFIFFIIDGTMFLCKQRTTVVGGKSSPSFSQLNHRGFRESFDKRSVTFHFVDDAFLKNQKLTNLFRFNSPLIPKAPTGLYNEFFFGRAVAKPINRILSPYFKDTFRMLRCLRKSITRLKIDLIVCFFLHLAKQHPMIFISSPSMPGYSLTTTRTLWTLVREASTENVSLVPPPKSVRIFSFPVPANCK